MPEEIPMTPEGLRRIKEAIDGKEGKTTNQGRAKEEELPLPIPIPIPDNDEDK